MAAPAVQFKTNYAVEKKFEPFYKGGKVQINKDGTHLLCICGNKLNVLEIATGAITRTIEQEDQEDITCFVLSPDDEILVTSSRALLLKQWQWQEGTCTRTWKAIHTAPVSSMTFDPTSTLLATGGCDSTIKIWDVLKQYCTHNLKGSSGVVHLVQFHPDMSRLQLFSSSMDYKIRIWDLKSSKCLCILETHYSAVTSLCFSPDGDTMISSGRDKICTVWDLVTNTPKRTVPVYESVEVVLLLPNTPNLIGRDQDTTSLLFITAGSKGILQVWDAVTSRCLYTQKLPHTSQKSSDEEGDEHSLTHCLLLPNQEEIVTVNAEHSIIMYDLHNLDLKKQFAGYNDEVLDVKFLGPSDSYIVVATNSPQIKVFELETSNCQILYGHTETVLALDVFKKGLMFASCAKDRTVRIWRMNKTTGKVHCVAMGGGHTNGVGAIACSRLKGSFIVSGSQDFTLKIWTLPESITKASKGQTPELESLYASVTEKAHDKDINSVAVSPNDKLIVSGSQDKTAKLWSASDLSLVGVLRGHKRGVWCVQFSPVDQVVATSSADGTLKLWGLQEFSCLKTFEGHDASVLKVIFVSRGAQLLTSGSDGLLKLWTIKTNECVKTLDGHEDKVWGLYGNKGDNAVVTGSADSSIVLWKDVTEVELAEAQAKEEKDILQKQELSNLLHEKRFLKALGLAISLDQPHTVLQVIKAILQEPQGKDDLEKNILRLRQDQKESVLRYCSVWNTNSRNCHEAQCVLHVLLTQEAPESLLQYSSIRSSVEGLIPYTERHMQRMGRLLQASMFVDYMWQHMRLTDLPMEKDSVPNPIPSLSLSLQENGKA
ncbi:transducin beta-like protein 3 [Dendropsophus ebraccatus]|uniref:transducin beta-like protein 3 n=1 Tax=Dendropsophus ebraccatus TaxID=150705 RepID=UPI003831B6A9